MEFLRDRTTSNQNTKIIFFPRSLISIELSIPGAVNLGMDGYVYFIEHNPDQKVRDPRLKVGDDLAINCDGNVVLCEVGVQDVVGDRGCPVWAGLERSTDYSCRVSPGVVGVGHIIASWKRGWLFCSSKVTLFFQIYFSKLCSSRKALLHFEHQGSSKCSPRRRETGGISLIGIIS